MSPAERRLLGRVAAIGLLLVLVALLWLGPVDAYLDLVDDNALRLSQQGELLQRYRVLARGQTAETTAAASDPGAILYPELSEAQAAALLQERLKTAAAAARVQVNGLQVLNPEVMPGAVRITVRIRGTADIAGLARLVYAIETAQPLLFPDNLQVQAQARPTGSAAETLDFQLDVSGFKPAAAT
jgi:hypothetical protein